MRPAAILVIALAAAPASAQEASPAIDWSKPVIGVDGNILQTQQKDAPTIVEVYTIDELKAAGSPSVEESTKLQPPQSCDPQKLAGDVRCTLPQQESTLSSEMREKLNRYPPAAKPE
jgi:hypothetical protein